jgi:hypothetical protein
MLPRAILRAAIGAVLLASAPASAQVAPPLSPGVAMAPAPVALHLVPPWGEPTSTGPLLPPGIAVLPLQLSLLSDAFPVGGAMPSLCDPTSDLGRSAGGFPLQRATYMALTPRLVLHGFSRQGCPVDAAAGGGLTYSIPLPRDFFIVASAGALAQPNAPSPARVRTDARLDLTWRATPDRAYSLGVGKKGITFGGQW